MVTVDSILYVLLINILINRNRYSNYILIFGINYILIFNINDVQIIFKSILAITTTDSILCSSNQHINYILIFSINYTLIFNINHI